MMLVGGVLGCFGEMCNELIGDIWIEIDRSLDALSVFVGGLIIPGGFGRIPQHQTI